ncbi:MAG: twin-arginine translocase TatA/TatE family subunit, partial [Alphaproteobacteria bacterium]
MSIGIWQIVLILAIVLILFGAGKIPRVMGDVAKGIKSFKSGMKEEESTEEVDKDDVVSSVKKETDTKSNK